MAAPSLVATSFVNIIGSAVTGSVSWQTSDVVILIAGTEGGGTETWGTPTTAGTGISLTRNQFHTSTSDPGAAVWSAVASASSSGTFTLTDPLSGFNVSLAVYIFRGSAGVGNSNISTGSTRTVSLTPTGADGSVVWGVYDWSAAAVVANTPTATTHSSAAPGPSASPNDVAVAGRYTYYVNELDDQTSAGAVSYGVGGTGTGPFTIIAIEAKSSGGAAAATPPHRQRMSPVPIIRAANF